MRFALAALLIALVICAPDFALAQTSPFLTGASALQTNIVAWLTPIAIILIMVLGGMAMANRVAQVSSAYGHGVAETIVENCGTTLILRCSGSESGGTSHFASKLIGEREISRRQVSRGQDRESSLSFRGARRSRNVTEQQVTEMALLPSELEQLPDLCGYLKRASSAVWLKVTFSKR
jgi:Type IV secretion-system coupling protein DNA-binding domain